MVRPDALFAQTFLLVVLISKLLMLSLILISQNTLKPIFIELVDLEDLVILGWQLILLQKLTKPICSKSRMN